TEAFKGGDHSRHGSGIRRTIGTTTRWQWKPLDSMRGRADGTRQRVIAHRRGARNGTLPAARYWRLEIELTIDRAKAYTTRQASVSSQSRARAYRRIVV